MSPEAGRSQVCCTCGAEADIAGHHRDVYSKVCSDNDIMPASSEIRKAGGSSQVKGASSELYVGPGRAEVSRMASQGGPVQPAEANKSHDDSIFYTVKPSAANRHRDESKRKLAFSVVAKQQPKAPKSVNKPNTYHIAATAQHKPQQRPVVSVLSADTKRHTMTQTSARSPSTSDHSVRNQSTVGYAPATRGVAMGQSTVDLSAFQRRLDELQARVERDRAEYLLQSRDHSDDFTATGRHQVGYAPLCML